MEGMIVCFHKWSCLFAITAGEAVWTLSIWPLNFSLWTGAAVGGRNAGREEISELASMGLSLSIGQVSRGKKFSSSSLWSQRIHLCDYFACFRV